MSNNLGPGVSRVLDPNGREFLEVILQQGKPPMDAEFNLLQELASDLTRRAVMRGTPSGWLGNETNAKADFVTDPKWSNWFKFGTQRTGEKQAVMWAVVNGWLVPITSTRTGTPPGAPNDVDTWNLIALDPPPSNSGDSRIDFVFLEVWLARVAPNPSATNKPNSSSIFRYGNVESGNSYVADDLIDPALGFETSQRVQLQYRIRVAKGLNSLTNYPDGFDPLNVKAKGAYDPTNPDTATSWTFQNMRKELGDAGLWRAGDGTANNLGTVDGYVYAIPLCAIFRRNGVAWNGDPAPNLNGGFNRNPTATNRSGVKTFSTIPTLASPITATSTSLTLASALNIPLPSSPSLPVYIRIGDEVMTYATVTGATVGGLVRGAGVAGTVAVPHPAGATVEVLSGRPDGLFADQVTHTDILDLRHAVNPNGFDYQALLRYNFDKLLKGDLHTNWKRAGTTSVLGPVLNYQDKITAGGVSLGITKIDSPDGIRMVYSDAITVQPVELILAAKTGFPPQNYSVTWGLTLEANRTSVDPGVAQFQPGDVIVVPVAQLKNSLPAGDADQARWCNEGNFQVEIRIDGDTSPLDPMTYTVTPAGLTANDDLTITLGASFPTTTRQLYVKLYVLYGAGRGLSRRPDVVHSVELLSPTATILHRGLNAPSLNYRLSMSQPLFWTKYVGSSPNLPYLPITAESYLDPASKTLILQPFRLIDLPEDCLTFDGTCANVTTGVAADLTNNDGSSNGTTTFESLGGGFLIGMVGKALVITNGPQPGRYLITGFTDGQHVVLDRPLLATTGGLSFYVYPGQGLMPTGYRDGTPGKWVTTDPLGMFSGSTDTHASTKNMYISLPSHLVPHAGAVFVPVLAEDAVATFAEGINFMFNAPKGGTLAASVTNVVPLSNGTVSYAPFSTLNLNFPYNPAVYNGVFTVGGNKLAGIRHFVDPTTQGRRGLQFPPFYGIARLFGVYEAQDYRVNGSPYDPSTRQRIIPSTGRAVNLLKQGFDGPTFWIEVDADGDATFVLSAEAIDITRSPNAISSFTAGHFVVEASIFGFDRDTFTQSPDIVAPLQVLRQREVRIVLAREGAAGVLRNEAVDPLRINNITAPVTGPRSVLPGPLPAADNALINYTRTPYGGDAWGTQYNNIDLGYQPGPLTSGVANQIVVTPLNPETLTRPNQKPFEVLASMYFSTTAGTGRISGYPDQLALAPGYENITSYPPSGPLDPRPNFQLGGLAGEPNNIPYLSRYNGCTERLPMGALWRDKDFRAVSFSLSYGHVQTGTEWPKGFFAGFSPPMGPDGQTMFCDGSVEPGTVIVHVDGNSTDYSLDTNYRTNRGGSGFIASGPVPGGYLGPGYVGVGWLFNSYTNVLAGAAYLVRNAPTTNGSVEVSAGNELMLVVTTQMMPTYDAPFLGFPITFQSIISTSGASEGNAAVDYYRIEGHPLVNDNVRMTVDPATIPLARNIIARDP